MVLKILAVGLAVTVSTSAMARKPHRETPNGQGYNQTYTGFPVWDYAAYRHYYRGCRCCRR
jgi:hypothetical protein